MVVLGGSAFGLLRALRLPAWGTWKTDVDRVHCSLLLASSGVDEVDNLLGIQMQVNARHIEWRLLLGSGLQNEDLAIRALYSDCTLLSGML